MTTNETCFFRDPAHYEAIRTVLLPRLKEECRDSRKLRFWSAAASTGQEACSLAMLLLEDGLADWNIQILGTDYSTPLLERARSGKYQQIEVNRGLPAARLVKYFRRSGVEWQLIESVRRLVRFGPIDLRKSMRALGLFELVFSRNVMIYFDNETKAAILKELHGTLFRGGLMLGGAETISIAVASDGAGKSRCVRKMQTTEAACIRRNERSAPGGCLPIDDSMALITRGLLDYFRYDRTRCLFGSPDLNLESGDFMPLHDNGINRRSIFRGSLCTAAAAGMPAGALQAQTAPATPKILNHQSGMKYRRVGNTDVHLSVIALGGLVMMEPVHHYAIDRGVNLVHIAADYLGGRAIVALGNVLKTRRKDVYLAVKDNFTDIDQTLKTLNTDYIDFIMFNRHKPSEAGDPRIQEQFERWKKQGKVRYAGLTAHGEVKETVGAGLASGMFTMVNPALNQPNLEAMQEELRLAHQKGVAVMAMKSMRGLKGIDLETAYLKKALLNPAVTTIVKGLGTFEMFDAYLKAANEPLTAREDRSLYRYAQANRSNNCMFCDECRTACPNGVEISTVLRCKDYYHDQLGDRLTAVSTYKSLPVARLGSESCAACHACEPACPNGIHIVDRLLAARNLFDGPIAG